MARDSGRVILMPKGDYVATTTYVALDWVRYDGRAWVCKQSCLGQVPHNGVYWQVLAQDGSVGEVPWSSVITKPFNSVGTDGLKVTENVLDVDFSKVQKPLENVSETAEDIADTDVMLVGAKKSLWSNIKSKIKNWIYEEFVLDSLEEISSNSQTGYLMGALAGKQLNSDLTRSYQLTYSSGCTNHGCKCKRSGNIVAATIYVNINKASMQEYATPLISGFPTLGFGLTVNLRNANDGKIYGFWLSEGILYPVGYLLSTSASFTGAITYAL